MKLSMWLIVENLKKYDPKYDIMDGDARISGVRFFSGEEQMHFDPQYVYLYLYTDAVSASGPYESTALVNGRDIILLQSKSLNDVLNDLLAVFDYYNTWETSLWEASSHQSFQKAIDLCDSALKNPIVLSNIDGEVLAMSSSFQEEDINEYWVETRESRHIPTSILGSPMKSADGRTASWTNEPREYLIPDGTKIVGAILSKDGEAAASIGIWEYKKAITPGDLWLIKILCNVLTSMINDQTKGTSLRSVSAIIADLLSGTEIDAVLLHKLEFQCKSPWQLLVIDNLYRSDIAYKRGMAKRFQDSGIPCIPLMYDDYVVILVSEQHAPSLIHSVLGSWEKQYYLAGLSLPFDDLQLTSARYRQTLFTLFHAEGTQGLYYSEDSAFQYLLAAMKKNNQLQGLAHPALGTLKRHDSKNKSELYDTLFQYLYHERSIQLGAQAMHIHRNSYLYRIQRIKEMLNIDLDDPDTRIYLLVSYLIEKLSSDG